MHNVANSKHQSKLQVRNTLDLKNFQMKKVTRTSSPIFVGVFRSGSLVWQKQNHNTAVQLTEQDWCGDLKI